jgi:peptide-methionine (R)-S-oxide reductase
MKKYLLFSFVILFTSFFMNACKSSKNKVDEKSVVEIVTKETAPTTDSPIPVVKSYIINSNGDSLEIIKKSEEEWKKVLTNEEYYVLRQKGTERAFTDNLWDNKKDGLYLCKACNTILFNAGTKFDSGTGWPSFYKPVDKKLIKEATDHDLGYARTEVMCGRCDGHLGHVFDDGPPPTGLRYCINGVSLNFIEAKN